MIVFRQIRSLVRWISRGNQPDARTVLLELNVHSCQDQPMTEDGTWVPRRGKRHTSAVYMMVDCVETASKSDFSYEENDKIVIKVHDAQLVSTDLDKRRLAIVRASARGRDWLLAAVSTISVISLALALKGIVL